MITPVQERIPIYLAAIGPKNTALAGEIADGWIPTFFSPEHVGEFRELLEEGAARAGRSLDGFDIAPTVSAYVSDDRELARNLMRPGAGAVHRRHGLAQAELLQQPRQALRLRGGGAGDPGPVPGRQEGRGAATAIPAELIDMVSLCGPRDVVRERLAAFRDAGVGTLMVSPMALTVEDRVMQLREIAELAG